MECAVHLPGAQGICRLRLTLQIIDLGRLLVESCSLLALSLEQKLLYSRALTYSLSTHLAILMLAAKTPLSRASSKDRSCRTIYDVWPDPDSSHAKQLLAAFIQSF